MKNLEKNEAIRLRKEGKSYSQISQILKVHRSSIKRWLRNLELSNKERENLTINNKIRFIDEAKNRSQKALLKRKKYQQSGRDYAKKEITLHIAGCMLYWAEGKQSKNILGITNSDINMIRFFIKFLQDCYNVSNDRLVLRINCYDDIYDQNTIENYWIKSLGLKQTNLRKTILNNQSKYSQNKKRGKLPYGTACLIVKKSTELVQNIYGAIQEYANFNNIDWLNKE
jgi:hypothetical protein